MDIKKAHLESFEYIRANTIEVFSDFKNDEYSQSINNNRERIDQIWSEENEKRQDKLLNNNILNLAIIERHETKLVLRCHFIEYKHYLAQRSGIALGITPLAVSGIAFYRENNSKKFFLGKRADSVTQYPGFFEFIPSGSIDASNTDSNNAIKYEEQLMIELKEELGISYENIKSCNAFCLILDEKEKVFDIGLELELENIRETSLNKSEYTFLENIPSNLIAEYMKKPNIVKTSRILFNAWSLKDKGGAR
jgi:hypothetical protein